jgi:hypothetical protein
LHHSLRSGRFYVSLRHMKVLLYTVFKDLRANDLVRWSRTQGVGFQGTFRSLKTEQCRRNAMLSSLRPYDRADR